MKEIVLPVLGEGISEALVVAWHVREGESVEAEQDIVEVVTDKAVFNIPASCSGRIKEITKREKEKARIGEVLAILE